MAYQAFSVVFGEQPSAAKWNILGTNDAEFNSLIQRDGTGLKLLDDSGNEVIKGVKTASAVNEVTVTNQATGSNPSIAATGGDTNIGLNLISKGTGEVLLNGVKASGAWETWTPTWENLTVGNGTQTASYKQIGKTVAIKLRLVFGSTTSISGTIAIVPPVTAANSYINTRAIIGNVVLEDAGTVNIAGGISMTTTTKIAIQRMTVVSSNPSYSSINATTPFTWTTNDEINFSGVYEAA